MKTLSIIVVLALGAAGTGFAQSVDVAGCYDLEIGAWSPTIDLGVDTLYVAPPPRIQMGTEPGFGLGGRAQGMLLEPAPGALPSVHRYSWWEEIGEDSVHLIWTTGYSGLRMRLGVQGRVLRGAASTFWDFGRATQTAPATATAVRCDAPLELRARIAYRFPRGIGFVGADSILVGESISSSGPELVEESERRFHAVGEPRAPFETATEIWVVVENGGLIRRIEARFGAEVSHEQIVERLSAAFGEPTVIKGENGPAGSWALWSGRLITISVSGGTEANPALVSINGR